MKPEENKFSSDETIIYYLINDELFKESIEAEFGPMVSIFADWHSDHLVYEFLDGSFKYSDLSRLLTALKDIGYIKEYMN